MVCGYNKLKFIINVSNKYKVLKLILCLVSYDLYVLIAFKVNKKTKKQTSSTCLNTLIRFLPASFPISSSDHLSDSKSSAKR